MPKSMIANRKSAATGRTRANSTISSPCSSRRRRHRGGSERGVASAVGAPGRRRFSPAHMATFSLRSRHVPISSFVVGRAVLESDGGTWALVPCKGGRVPTTSARRVLAPGTDPVPGMNAGRLGPKSLFRAHGNTRCLAGNRRSDREGGAMTVDQWMGLDHELRRVVPRQPVDWQGFYALEGDQSGRWRSCRFVDISQAGAGLVLSGTTPEEAEGRRVLLAVQLRAEVKNLTEQRGELR